MKFRIDKQIFEKFPGLNVGVVIVKGLDNTGTCDLPIREEEKRLKESFEAETLSQHPKIEIWRDAYRKFGAKPKEHKSSIENLYKLILKGNELRQINKLVNIYNYISIKYMLPAGGEDLDKMEGDLVLTFATNEVPVLLLGDKEEKAPKEGEVIYKDEKSTICRRWNWREADRTKLTEETKNSILVIEGLPPVTKEEIEIAMKELSELIQKFCGGEIISSVIDNNNSEIEF